MPFLSSTFVLSGRFTDGQKIGQGGCGTVYFAKDSHLGRSVAVKEALPINNSFLATQIRFTRESRIQAALQHTSIIAVYHLEKEPQNGELYLICEYANGGSLEDYLEKHGKLSEEQTIKIALDICAALEVTAREQIVHRDIKPSNILLKVDKTGAIIGAKLGDFGIAQDRESLTTMQQGMGQPGTALYMAPEQASSANVLDVRADIFALGITLWEVLTCEDYKPLLNQTRTPQLSHYNPRTSRGIATIIQKAVQNDPVQRYGTPQQMAADLRVIGKPVHPFSSFRGILIITFLLVFVLGLAYLFLLGDKNRPTPIARLTATSMNNTSVTSIATIAPATRLAATRDSTTTAVESSPTIVAPTATQLAAITKVPTVSIPPTQTLPSSMASAEIRDLTGIAIASASSVLPSEETANFGLVRFDPGNALDRDPATSWVEGVVGSGIGQQLRLVFPEMIFLTRLGIDIGFDRDESIFYANNRVRRIHLIFSDGSAQSADFLDQRGIQYTPILNISTNSVTIVIDDVYRGSQYDDTPIAEVEVWGYTSQ